MQASRLSALDHALPQFGFGRKADRVWDMGGVPARQIAAPVVGQIQLTVDEGVASGGDVGEEDADLTVFHPSRQPTVLRSDASGVTAPFGIEREDFGEEAHFPTLAQWPAVPVWNGDTFPPL
jgi:hypothetical protein